MNTNISIPPGGPNPFLNERQTSPDFSIINWEYYESAIDKDTIVYSYDVYPYDEKIVKIYKDFIDFISKRYPELIYTFERSQWTFGRLRLRIVLNSERLAQNFEPILPKLISNNLIKNTLNISDLEEVAYYRKTINLVSKHKETIIKTINNLFELTSQYEDYAYHYLDALRLIKENIRIIYKQIPEIIADRLASSFTLEVFNKKGFLTLKIEFLAKCIFSGFFCITTDIDLEKVSIYTYIPFLLKIRNEIYTQKIFKEIHQFDYFPIVLNSLICEYLNSEPEFDQLNHFFNHTSIDELISFVDTCSKARRIRRGY